jgi:hypothetical protein
LHGPLQRRGARDILRALIFCLTFWRVCATVGFTTIRQY